MVWTLHRQQQQRGAQLPARERRAGEPPADAVRDRAAQDHEQADLAVGGRELPPGEYPASRIEHREGDVAPTAPEPHVEWDEVVQPEKAKLVDFDKQPLPDGK